MEKDIRIRGKGSFLNNFQPLNIITRSGKNNGQIVSYKNLDNKKEVKIEQSKSICLDERQKLFISLPAGHCIKLIIKKNCLKIL